MRRETRNTLKNFLPLISFNRSLTVAIMTLHCLWSLTELHIQNKILNPLLTRSWIPLNLGLSMTMHTFVISGFDNKSLGMKLQNQVVLGFGYNSMPCDSPFRISSVPTLVTWGKPFAVTCYCCQEMLRWGCRCKREGSAAELTHQGQQHTLSVWCLGQQFLLFYKTCLWIALLGLVGLFNAFITFPVGHNSSKMDIRFHNPFPCRKRNVRRRLLFVIAGLYKKPHWEKKNWN